MLCDPWARDIGFLPVRDDGDRALLPAHDNSETAPIDNAQFFKKSRLFIL